MMALHLTYCLLKQKKSENTIQLNVKELQTKLSKLLNILRETSSMRGCKSHCLSAVIVFLLKHCLFLKFS